MSKRDRVKDLATLREKFKRNEVTIEGYKQGARATVTLYNRITGDPEPEIIRLGSVETQQKRVDALQAELTLEKQLLTQIKALPDMPEPEPEPQPEAEPV